MTLFCIKARFIHIISPMSWINKTLHPSIIEPNVAHQSKSLPNPGLKCLQKKKTCRFQTSEINQQQWNAMYARCTRQHESLSRKCEHKGSRFSITGSPTPHTPPPFINMWWEEENLQRPRRGRGIVSLLKSSQMEGANFRALAKCLMKGVSSSAPPFRSAH